MRRIKLPCMSCEIVSREIGDFVVDAVFQNRSSGCAIGLSGGVDSSTTAALIKAAFERHNKTSAEKFELIGYALPSNINNTEDAKDAETLAQKLGIRYEVHAIEKLVASFQAVNPEAFEDNYHRGNLISRVRANVLSTKAATEHKILCGTGNKDEDFGIGYYTLFGDGAVHISPIGGLSKRLVREMAAYIGVADAIIQRVPTAGLEPGQSDFKDLGYDYDVVELVTEGFEQGFSREQLAVHEQIVPLVEKQIRLYQSTFGKPRHESVDQVIDDISQRHQVALKKVKIIHPPTPEITLSYK